MFKRILVPVDGSDLSGRAMDVSVALAQPLGAVVVGFIADPTPSLPTVGRASALIEHETELHDRHTKVHAKQVLARSTLPLFVVH